MHIQGSLPLGPLGPLASICRPGDNQEAAEATRTNLQCAQFTLDKLTIGTLVSCYSTVLALNNLAMKHMPRNMTSGKDSIYKTSRETRKDKPLYSITGMTRPLNTRMQPTQVSHETHPTPQSATGVREQHPEPAQAFQESAREVETWFLTAQSNR